MTSSGLKCGFKQALFRLTRFQFSTAYKLLAYRPIRLRLLEFYTFKKLIIFRRATHFIKENFEDPHF
jgi:hypothetical protein